MSIFSGTSKQYKYYNKDKSFKRRIISFIKFLFIFFLSYQVITSFLITSFIVHTQSMTPSIESGDRLLVSPLIYGPFFPFSDKRITGFKTPQRGDIVIARPAYTEIEPWYIKLFNPIVGFFTLQKINLSKYSKKEWKNRIIAKRVIGLPGDTIKIDNFIISIRKAGDNGFSEEFSVINPGYQVNIDPLPENWEKLDLFSGNMDAILLGSDDYFLIGDNRTASNDSRYWGPVSNSQIIGKVFLKIPGNR